jgi:adenylosuccinate synthase
LLKEKVKPMVRETVSYMHSKVKDRNTILVEGAQSTILDIDFGKFDFRT